MKRLIIVVALLATLVSASGSSVAAYSPLSGACDAGGDAQQSSACAPGTAITGKNGVLKKVSTIIATIAGIAAVIVVMIGGLQYVLSAGSAEKAASARSAIIGGVVGLVIIASAQGILLFVLSRLN